MGYNQEKEASDVERWDKENLNPRFTKGKGAGFLRQFAGRMDMICVERVAFSLASCVH